MRCRLRRLSNLVGFVVALIVVADAHAQPVKPPHLGDGGLVGVDGPDAGDRDLHRDLRPGWNPCTFNGNPTAAQEACNACVRDTINFDPTCASTWDASCRTDYTNCIGATDRRRLHRDHDRQSEACRPAATARPT
jgi:hypothetical protein